MFSAGCPEKLFPVILAGISANQNQIQKLWKPEDPL
jgi:hypothetical protein